MDVTARTVLLVVALILFVVAAAAPAVPTRVNLTAAGLAFFAAAFLFP